MDQPTHTPTHIILNPIAGRRQPGLVGQIAQALGARVWETAGPGHATQLARQAAQSGAEAVIAAGGDGTAAEVAAGLARLPVKMGLIPAGTANVLARELRLPFTAAPLLSVLHGAHVLPIWPGLMHHASGTRLFLQMAGVGFDADVTRTVNPDWKRALGRGAYVLRTLQSLRGYPFTTFPVWVDGAEYRASSVVVSKGRLYGGRYPLAADARSYQRDFSVTVFPKAGALRMLGYGAALPLNLLPHLPGLIRLRGRQIEIGGDAPAQIDGDHAGQAPIRIENPSAPIRFIVPAPLPDQSGAVDWG